MNKMIFSRVLFWGFILWFFGYVLGFLFFVIVPKDLIGWFVTPFGIVFILWVLFKKIILPSIKSYFYLAIIWTTLAIILDYFFIVKLLNSVDYYKFDIYFYYFSTFALPLLVGWLKTKKPN
jgi:hypothetical protein